MVSNSGFSFRQFTNRLRGSRRTAGICLFLGLSSLFSLFARDFSITLDYRFDNGYFSEHPERKVPLEYAVSLWEAVLNSPASIPEGTQVTLRNDYTRPGYITVTFDETVNSFVIFIYAHDFSREVKADGSSAASTSKAFGGNWGADYDFGYIAFNTNAPRSWFFDQTPETEYDVPVRDSYDLITSAVHEMGHVLGILRSRQAPYVYTFGEEDERFDGPATRLINGGYPIPLEYDSSHIRGNWWNGKYLPLPPIDRHVMHTSDPVQGFRQVMTAVDLVMFEEMGWEVEYDNLPEYPYTPIHDYRKDNLSYYFGIDPGETGPSGLWVFDDPQTVEAAIIGLPLRYYPASGEIGGLPDLVVSGGVKVPRGGWLFCVPGLSATGGGNECNNYTPLFDVKISNYGQYYTLYNTNPFAGNDGELFIHPDGYFGAESGGYSDQRIPVDQWIRLGITVDGHNGFRRHYIDGLYSHSVDDVTIDGAYAIYPEGADYPFFCLFGDNNGEDGTIVVKRVILYDRVLDSQEMRSLGSAGLTDFGL